MQHFCTETIFAMVLILDGSLEYGAQVFRFVEVIWLHRMCRQIRFFSLGKYKFYIIRTQDVLSYHLIYVPWLALTLSFIPLFIYLYNTSNNRCFNRVSNLGNRVSNLDTRPCILQSPLFNYLSEHRLIYVLILYVPRSLDPFDIVAEYIKWVKTT